jgi:hypothetical protein
MGQGGEILGGQSDVTFFPSPACGEKERTVEGGEPGEVQDTFSGVAVSAGIACVPAA